MTVEMLELELHILMDAAGDFVVHKDEGELAQAWEDDIGGSPSGPMRQFTVKLNVPKPEAVVLTGTVPAENTEGCELKVA